MLFYPHSLNWLGDHCRRAYIFVFVAIFSAAFSVSAEPVLPVLTSDTKLATAGYYQLSWRPGLDGAPSKIFHYELQQAVETDFKTTKIIYQGTDRASVISGLPNGKYYYRVRVIRQASSPGAWSEPVCIEVHHHSLVKALWFFATGAVVFFMTLFFIVSKSRKSPVA